MRESRSSRQAEQAQSPLPPLFYGRDRRVPPRPSDYRISGELEISQHAPAGVRACAINLVASGGGFYLRYDGAVGVTRPTNPNCLQ